MLHLIYLIDPKYNRSALCKRSISNSVNNYSRLGILCIFNLVWRKMFKKKYSVFTTVVVELLLLLKRYKNVVYDILKNTHKRIKTIIC